MRRRDTVGTAGPDPIRDLGAGVVRVDVEGVGVILAVLVLGANRRHNRGHALLIDAVLARITILALGRAVEGASSIPMLLNNAADIRSRADIVTGNIRGAGEIGIAAVGL